MSCFLGIILVMQVLPYTLERAPWPLLSYLLARVGGLLRVGALSNVQNNVKIWALFLSESSGVGALSRVGRLSRLGALSSVYGTKNKSTSCELSSNFQDE